MESFVPYLFGALFLLVGGGLVYKVFRHGGLKAAMFGARIERTVGEVGGEKQGGLVGVTVKVHLLRREMSERLVGIEIAAKSVASFQMTPATLSVEDARRLADLLRDAVQEASVS